MCCPLSTVDELLTYLVSLFLALYTQLKKPSQFVLTLEQTIASS